LDYEKDSSKEDDEDEQFQTDWNIFESSRISCKIALEMTMDDGTFSNTREYPAKQLWG
jgi:hypothetical protein